MYRPLVMVNVSPYGTGLRCHSMVPYNSATLRCRSLVTLYGIYRPMMQPYTVHITITTIIFPAPPYLFPPHHRRITVSLQNCMQ
ncbi:hypothetical protein E2C01_029843 [Portunus trituberculatus]|uniref:Uncharacterized protein n=1 Tax=Portunus trituberculatus TaxID=210409 RepID=A0A5B7ET29_PORTR|nr:hypothetical protein [Portunus trituberculatus]